MSGTERRWVVIKVYPFEDIRWSFDMVRGKELLRDTLDKRTGNTHWLPRPEEIREHQHKTLDLYARAENYFMLPQARAAGQERGLPWELAWRFESESGEVLHQSLG